MKSTFFAVLTEMNLGDETLNTAKKCGTGLMCLRCDGTSLTTQFPGLDVLVHYCSPLPHRMSHGPEYLYQRGKSQFGNPKWNQQEEDSSQFSLSCATPKPQHTWYPLPLLGRHRLPATIEREPWLAKHSAPASRINRRPLITALSQNATGMLIKLQPHWEKAFESHLTACQHMHGPILHLI